MLLLQLLEAAWCLTNIAAGEPEETKSVLPALPLLIGHLGGSFSPFCSLGVYNVLLSPLGIYIYLWSYAMHIYHERWLRKHLQFSWN